MSTQGEDSMLKTERTERRILARGYAKGRLDALDAPGLPRITIAEGFATFYLDHVSLGLTVAWVQYSQRTVAI